MGFSDGDPLLESGSESYIEDLVLELRTCFFELEFQNVAKKLVNRENILIKKYIELKKKSDNEKKLLLFKNQELETEIERLKKVKDVCEKKVKMYKEKFVDLEKRVSLLEETPKDATTAAPASVENSRPLLSSEKGDSNRKTELKLPEIIDIDDDSDDEDNLCISSILKRKRCSKEITKKCNSDDNDLDCESTLKTKRVSVEIKKELDDDYVNNILTGTPHMNKLEKFHKQVVGSTEVKLNNIQSFFNVSNSSSAQHLEIIDGIYKSVLAKWNKQKQTWQFEEDMIKDFSQDDELCLNAVCALRRQKIIVHGSDMQRLNDLMQLLTDADSERKLTKTASELNESDLVDCRMLARKYSFQIFGIYQRKDDPFFPTRS
uniref:uncharacterized protein LOC122579400 n=1 Tax=Erigeron canadensis TaxID=72917 RepID=UPI001CB8F3EB|nr:uncharacterized protein LOC122579400 [Erigeron canadensis]